VATGLIVWVDKQRTGGSHSFLKIKNLLVLVPNIVFSIYFVVVIVLAGQQQDSVVASVAAQLSDPDSMLRMIGSEIIDPCLTQKVLVVFGAVFVLYLILWRIVSYMRIHPRIALFVNTMSAATGEIFHFLITFFIVASGMAIIGVFTFDYTNVEFTSFQGALFQLFHFQLGDDWDAIPNWRDSWEGILFFILLPVLLIFTLLNFLLAVIIDTYVKVREKTVEKKFAHQSIFLELLDIPKSVVMYYIFDLPTRGEIIQALFEMDSVRVVRFGQLSNAINNDTQAVVKFAQFYHSFYFLKIDESTPIEDDDMGLSGKRINHIEYPVEDGGDNLAQQFEFISSQLHNVLVQLQLKKQILQRVKQKRARPMSVHSQSVVSHVTGPPPSLVDETDADETQSYRGRILSEYHAARTVKRLTNAHIKSRQLIEYMRRARRDAELLINDSSNNSSARRSQRTADRNSIFRSLVLHENNSFVELNRGGSRGSLNAFAGNSRRSSFNIANR
jgi:hypothetical protein